MCPEIWGITMTELLKFVCFHTQEGWEGEKKRDGRRGKRGSSLMIVLGIINNWMRFWKWD